MEFITYPKIRRINDLFIGEKAPGYRDLEGMLDHPEQELVIEEKIDGANCRFMLTKSGELIFGSREHELSPESDSRFTKFREFITAKLNDISAEIIEKYLGCVFFGEGCWKHSTNYDWNNMPIFLGFDIKMASTGRWVPFPYCKEIFDELTIPFVPVIKIIKVKDIQQKLIDEDVPISKYSHNQAEGILIKNYGTGQFAKHVISSHQEKNKKAFGGSPKMESDDTLKLVAKWCTNSRIDKIIFKLIDDGEFLGMSLMKYLPKRVLDDMYEEGIMYEIYQSKKTVNLDMALFKKKVILRCKTVLQQIIDTNERLDQIV